MSAALETALDALEGMTFVYARKDMTEAERAAASANNMACVRAWSAANKALLAEIDAAFPDRSAGAIWRAAYQQSITQGRSEQSRQWKARALRLNPEPVHNAIALSGMAPLQFDGRWMLAVALPQPAPVGDLGYNVEDVVLIDPKAKRAEMMFDVGATHYAPPVGLVDRVVAEVDPIAWARAIALERLEWWKLRGERRQAMQAEPTWCGWPSAALMLAPPEKVRWSDFSGSLVQVPAELRQRVNRAILAQARLPRVEGRA